MKNVKSNNYSPEELATMLEKMKAVCQTFYWQAADTGCHTFIEFAGLMNEFIKVCEQSAAAGVDFANASTHTGKPLVVYTYNATYIVEKLDCVFGPTIKSSPEVRAEFAKILGRLDVFTHSPDLYGAGQAQARRRPRIFEPDQPGPEHDEDRNGFVTHPWERK